MSMFDGDCSMCSLPSDSDWCLSCKKKMQINKRLEQEISNRIFEELDKAFSDKLSTTSTTNIINEPLTPEKLVNALQKIKDSLPSFDLLDQMIDNGYNIEDLVLIIYSEKTNEEVIQTKHGALKVIGSPVLNPEYAYLIPDYRPYSPMKIQWE